MAVVEGLKQMHKRRNFKAMVVRKLTQREKQRSMEGLMILSTKHDGKIKGWIAYNGNPTWKWVS